MRVLAVGGGSGGHVTSVVAVYKELLKHDPELQFEFVCDKGFREQTEGLFANTSVKVHVISAGKLRRYANLKWFMYFHPYHLWHTHLANVADIFKIGIGYLQSLSLVKKSRPDVLFAKGGFVSVPVGMAAERYHIPIVIHDSDVMPGLANRILSRVAVRICTGSPIDNYPMYPRDITKYVGVPVDKAFFQKLSIKEKKNILKRYGFNAEYPLVLITGGGGGSDFFNNLTTLSMPKLADEKVQVLLLAGRKAKTQFPNSEYFQAVPFVDGLADVIRAADIVVSRAGASSFAELAAASKPTILIPHPHLSGDHQSKNAAIYNREGVVVTLQENGLTADVFADTISRLLSDKKRLRELSESIHKLAKPDALVDMVELILEVGENGKKK